MSDDQIETTIATLKAPTRPFEDLEVDVLCLSIRNVCRSRETIPQCDGDWAEDHGMSCHYSDHRNDIYFVHRSENGEMVWLDELGGKVHPTPLEFAFRDNGDDGPRMWVWRGLMRVIVGSFPDCAWGFYHLKADGKMSYEILER